VRAHTEAADADITGRANVVPLNADPVGRCAAEHSRLKHVLARSKRKATGSGQLHELWDRVELLGVEWHWIVAAKAAGGGRHRRDEHTRGDEVRHRRGHVTGSTLQLRDRKLVFAPHPLELRVVELLGGDGAK